MAMIQIRNVPPDLHERLKQRAASQGMNLSDYLKGELERIVAVPTNADIMAWVQADREAGRLLGVSADEIVRGIREDRDSR
ncbi:MAG: hypothetical protein U9R51_10005 [Actinomycetota bacterium]|nr:hypothetical protein [Actinomycetota bacterium]